MRTILKLLLPCLVLSSTACKKEDEKPLEMKHVVLTEKQEQVISSSNSFGLTFFKNAFELSGENKNFMVSPLSVSMALGMTRNGAAGSTLESMTNTLGFAGMSEQEINESYKYLMETFTTLDPDVKLLIANSIWHRNNFSVIPAFLNTNMDYFKAEVNSLDFDNPESVDMINGWASENTNGLIPSIIEEIPEGMVMYLINAVYFKGQWKYQFDKENTKVESFTLGNGSIVEVPSMIQETTLPLMVRDNFEVVQLPYNRGNFMMSVILPNTGVSLSETTTQLTSENWNSWENAFADTKVHIQLPKFKFSYDEDKMKEILSAMGMEVAFSESNADFTRMNPEGGIFISEIKHKTFIETDEEGSTAAAVTSVGMGTTSAPMVHQFIVDRPFIFVISEKSTGTILFMGAVNNPS